MHISGRSMRAAVARATDAALEVSIAGGFGSPGIRVRRRLAGWVDPPPMDGRCVLITGATSGIGLAAATEMARLGAQVGIVGRDPQRTASTAAQIEAEVQAEHADHVGQARHAQAGTRPVAVFVADLTRLADAHRLAAEVAGAWECLDVLVHNAGALSADYQLTEDGFEATYATQVLSQHVITSGLLGHLARGRRPRVVTVSSGGMYAEALDLATVQSEAQDYDGVRAYARAKRAQVVLAAQWARRFPAPIQFHSMHPGWADTPGVRDALPRFHRLTSPILRTPAEGADTIVWLAAVESVPGRNGSFWLDRQPRGTVRMPGTSRPMEVADALWEMVCAQTGVVPRLP
ncbi:MAG: SDR family NAD(P)-dependent oxidoreductase [Candidatus Nanopelagicales bacterium]